MTERAKRRRPVLRLRWVVAAILVVLLAVLLVVAGLASSQVANDAKAHEPVGSATVPAGIAAGGSIVDGTRNPVTSTGIPARTIVLTFDDGPDPTWTPQVLAVLRKHQVPGTFFVVGSMASRYPDVTRSIVDSGSELGSHTFTHADMVGVSPWRVERELDQTQLVLAGTAGVTTTLFRPPFSSSASAIDDLGYQTVLRAGERGYLTVFTDQDSQDWGKPGVDAIVRNSIPPDGKGATVLLHDAGGDRSQTVAALDVLIPRLRAEGYRFTTVTGALGLPPANQPAVSADRFTGDILLGAITASLVVVDVLRWVLLVVGVLVVLRLALMVWVAIRHARRRRAPGWGWGEPVTEPVSVVVPAYNEAANIEASVRSIAASDHPVDVVVVDDGSTDGTAELVERLRLPNVRVIRRPNGGKPAALNTGIMHARHDLIVMVDGDTVFERDTVRLLVQPFGDRSIGAVAGNVKIANREGFLTRLQHIEYVVGFNVDRRVHDMTASMCTIPGAAGAFRRAALIEVGGLSEETLAEDTDLTIAIGRAGWRTVYQDKAVAWTEAPITLNALWKQRFRWTYGTMQALWKHRRAIVARGAAGRLGRFGLLHVIAFQIVLPVTAPLIDLFFVYGLFFLDPGTTLLLWLSVLLVQTATAAVAFHLDGEPKGPLWLIPAQQLVYRQLMYIVLAQSLIAAASGVRVRWQRMRRVGALDALAHSGEPATVPTGLTSLSTADTVRLSPVAEPRTKSHGRDRWLDSLRLAALAWMIGYQLTGASWLTLAFPAAGVLFASGGSLMARSLRDTPTVDVVGHRIRRLLPPLWLFALVMVPLMLVYGWLREPGQGERNWADLVLWVFPVLDPPASSWHADWTSVTWLIRAFLWFVLLTPLLLAGFRRRPVAMLLAPVTLVAVDTAAGSPLSTAGPFGRVLLDLGVFGACWMLGFAHQEGLLRRTRPAVLAGVSAVAVGLGGWWSADHRLPDGTIDLTEIPLGQALVSAGLVAVLLSLRPPMAWLDRIPVLGRLVTAMNLRLITIYLWSTVAIDLAVPLGDALGVSSWAAQGVLTAVLLAVAVLAFGWVEDLAARRRPRLIPDANVHSGPGSRPGAPRTPWHRQPEAVTAGVAPAMSPGRTSPMSSPKEKS
jgi:cellulose synthase/poly-beta-1,6-N-acetylglucosamine synthase-like glycosyltransferase/peptidoglycan/xylan/chitin deacetylase (PgdA/CDA1 family)/peptidoglycan/LPS O-acetylase OafA/YrhL